MKNYLKSVVSALTILHIIITTSTVYAFGFPAHIRNNLVGEMLTTPVIVEGQLGTTVISGNTIINPGYIISVEKQNPASLLEARVAEHGNRIIMRNNRIINNGQISHISSGKAGLAVVNGGQASEKTQIETMNNTYQNRGVVKSQ